MLIASKYEEMYPPEVRDFIWIADNAYSRQQIVKLEGEMLKVRHSLSHRHSGLLEGNFWCCDATSGVLMPRLPPVPSQLVTHALHLQYADKCAQFLHDVCIIIIIIIY